MHNLLKRRGKESNYKKREWKLNMRRTWSIFVIIARHGESWSLRNHRLLNVTRCDLLKKKKKKYAKKTSVSKIVHRLLSRLHQLVASWPLLKCVVPCVCNARSVHDRRCSFRNPLILRRSQTDENHLKT